MKIASLTMIGNECEIIESFIRYNYNFLDEMIFIYETGCVDGSLDIIKNLMKEGYCIQLMDESLVSFEVRTVENKYLKVLAAKEGIDMIIPLDADEFLTAYENPRIALEKLTLDKVYYMNWRNYVMHPNDDTQEKFIPKRISHYIESEEDVTKVIVPSRLVEQYKITLTAGHHSVNGRKGFAIERLSHICIAHFPVISEAQYLSRIYCNSILFILWMNRGNGEGQHLNMQLARLEAEDNLYSNAAAYSTGGDGEEELFEEKLNLSYCDEGSLIIKYTGLSEVNVQKNLIRVGQIMALKAYNLEIEKKEWKTAPRILVYGTGKSANGILNGAPEDLVNIRAYIDSNPVKKFTKFNRRIVVTPDLIRYFPYEVIVIASVHYEEIHEILIGIGIPKEKIKGTEYILNRLISKLGDS